MRRRRVGQGIPWSGVSSGAIGSLVTSGLRDGVLMVLLDSHRPGAGLPQAGLWCVCGFLTPRRTDFTAQIQATENSFMKAGEQ